MSVENKTCPTTDDDVTYYQEHGFIQYPQFFSGSEVEELRGAIDEAIGKNRERIVGAPGGGRSSKEYEQVFNQMVNLWRDFPLVKCFAHNAALAESARRLSGSRHVRIYHDHAMVKPGGEESRATNWHQDAPFWPMDSVGALSAWIAVDDVCIENGCLQFVPQSHKFGLQEGIALAKEGDSIVDKMKARGHTVQDPVAVEMAAGGVTFHHGCNFHFAGPNQTENRRRAFAIIYIPDHIKFTGGSEAAGAGDEMKAGGPWDHPVHPILAGNS